MKTIRSLTIGILLFISFQLVAQKTEIIPDLGRVTDTDAWTVINRDLTFEEAVYLDARENDGLLILNDFSFENGRIELDIKGKDVQGKSFVGLAFHGLNDSVFDVVYFRPFNFKSPERGHHAVQYVAHPEYPWYRMRQEFPEQYENPVKPVPEPDEWFHATIIIDYPVVKAYVNDSKEPSLVVEQINDRKRGYLGFWVGYGSDGWFRNLRIYPE